MFKQTTEIYTNRSTDLLQVKLSESTAVSEVVIYNTIGQVQYRQSYPIGQKQMELDITSLMGGIYICEVRMGTQRATKKFSRMK